MSIVLGLQPIKEWGEDRNKDSNFRAGTIRIYVGSLHVGFAEPTREDATMYHFRSMLQDVTIGTFQKETLEDIKINVECALKEYIKKFVKIIQK